MAYYDFAKIKADIPIERSLIYLKLKFEKDSNGWRLDCPQCGGERSIAINPELNKFYCHDAEIGGDVLSFVAHVLGYENHKHPAKSAAEFLLEHSAKPEAKKTVPKKVEERKGPISSRVENGIQPLSQLEKILESLVHEHKDVQALGISPEEAELADIGYKPQGLYKGQVVGPNRLRDGHTICVSPLAKDFQFPKTLQFPASNVIPLNPKKRA